MKKITNRTPEDWGLFSDGDELTAYCEENKISPNMALAGFADVLTSQYEDLADMGRWTDIEFSDVEAILLPLGEFGATDSEGFTCAANLLVELYGLTGTDAKVAYCQFRYPAPSAEETKAVEALKATMVQP